MQDDWCPYKRGALHNEDTESLTDVALRQQRPRLEFLQAEEGGGGKERSSTRIYSRNISPAVPQFHTSNYGNLQKYITVVLSYPVCGTLLWQS